MNESIFRLALVVIADESLRRLIITVMERRGFDAFGVATTEKAVAALSVVRPELVVSDGSDGAIDVSTLARWTAPVAGKPAVPLVILGWPLDLGLRRRMQGIAVDGFVELPFSVQRFNATVDPLIERAAGFG